jgi:polysaccharide biosynthesis protein PslG
LLASVTLSVAVLAAYGFVYLVHQDRSRKADSSSLIFGMADPDLVGEPAALQASQLAAMKAIGIKSVRLDANWSWVQPANPRDFDWSQLDQAVNSVRDAGMSADLIIDGCPSWAALAGTIGDPSPQPASSAQYATWAAEVAARYRPDGVNTFEIWNEPNAVGFWQPKPDPSAYTADLTAAYSSIKAVDPSAFVISGGLAPGPTRGNDISPIDFLQAMYADGAKGNFDALGFHAYSYPALPKSYQSWSGWSEMAQTDPSVRRIMTRNGDGNKPLWITEFGAPTQGTPEAGDSAQALAITQAITDAKATKWIGAIYLYTWQDNGNDPSNPEDWFGLSTSGGVRKPAYSAVSAALKQ